MATYSSSGPCDVEGAAGHLESKLWFTTPALDEYTISRIEGIQLFTDSESHFQGELDNTSASSLSWFELVILDSPEHTAPRTLDGLQLSWRSHDIPADSPKLIQSNGTSFQREDDIRNLLKPNNAIGIRVCSQLPGSRIHAIEASLEITLSDSPVEQKQVTPTTEVVEKAEHNQELLRELQEFYGDEPIELSPDSLQILRAPLSWGLKASDVSRGAGPDEKKLKILCLDGGGIRGLSSLLMLEGIMNELGKSRNGEVPRPCEVFDLIGGTSTGGLIAIMLGRLGMTVRECIEKYKDFAGKVFSASNWEIAKNEYNDAAKYSASGLEDAVKSVIASRGLNPDTEPLLSKDKNYGGCRCVVFACSTRDLGKEVVNFRNYPWQGDTSTAPTLIWQAARATCAAPTYFKEIRIGQVSYVDGGMQANNPVWQTYIEADHTFERGPPMGCVVSLGTGVIPPLELRDNHGIGGNALYLQSLLKNMKDIVTSTERAHDQMAKWSESKRWVESYFRFNAPLGRKIENGKEVWFADAVALDDLRLMDQMEKGTQYYVTNVVPDLIAQCAKYLLA